MSQKRVARDDRKLSRTMRSHLRHLNLHSIAEYRDWCVTHGLPSHRHKTAEQMLREQRFAERLEVERKQNLARRQQANPLGLIRDVHAGRVSQEDVSASSLPLYYQANSPQGTSVARQSAQRNALMRLLTVLHRRGCDLLSSAQVDLRCEPAAENQLDCAILRIADYHDKWIREPEAWKPATRSRAPRKVIASLLRHLFVQYELPEAMDTVWFMFPSGPESLHWLGYFLHVGQGHNLCDCMLPIPYTKRMAHYFMRSPREMHVLQALRYGQVRGLGGSKPLALALCRTRLGNNLEHDTFWVSVIRWLIAHPQVPLTAIPLIVSYLHFQRFEPADHHMRWGAPDVEPPQPNLSMRRRDPEKLRQQAQAWRDGLFRGRRERVVPSWDGCGLPGFDWLDQCEQTGKPRRWTIREIQTGKGLIYEGRRMRHCVGSYSQLCAIGQSSIWALESEIGAETTKRVTIDVRPKTRQVVQVCGKFNRGPDPEEQTVIRHWAKETGLSLASCGEMV